MAKWMVYAKKADFNQIAECCGVSPVTARLIRNRDVCGAEETGKFLNGTMNDLHSPVLLHGLTDAADLIYTKIENGRSLRVIGDYDVDGVCSSYILYRTLKHLGGKVDVRLPHRVLDGYGINERLVDEAVSDGVDTIITCDNGIAASAALQKAKDEGLCVIVTDHHEIPFKEDENGNKQYVLPPADHIVEPKLVDPATGRTYYPFTEICGAVVAFKLSQVLLDLPDISQGIDKDITNEQKVLRELLSFTALATVCDVMPLTDENRIIVKQGLLAAQRTENPGLASLIMVTGMADKEITAYHAGFVLGPCINASGRLDSAQRALSLFMTEDLNEAAVIAAKLKELNDSRKAMTENGFEKAEQVIQKRAAAAGGIDPVIVVSVPDCHESIAGIIAGRLKEKYSHPVFVLTESGDDPDILKGSGRSIEAFDMYEHMHRISELFIKYGGHKLAAGLSIRKNDLEKFTAAINADCGLEEKDYDDTLHIDMELPVKYVDMKMVNEFSLLEPFGTANPKPLFVTRDIELTLKQILGKNKNVYKLTGRDDLGRQYDFIYYHKSDAQAPPFEYNKGVLCNVVYVPEINSWKGIEKLQFVIKDWKMKG